MTRPTRNDTTSSFRITLSGESPRKRVSADKSVSRLQMPGFRGTAQRYVLGWPIHQAGAVCTWDGRPPVDVSLP